MTRRTRRELEQAIEELESDMGLDSDGDDAPGMDEEEIEELRAMVDEWF